MTTPSTLFPDPPPPGWSVVPIYARDHSGKKSIVTSIVDHYELQFLGKTHLKLNGEHGRKRLEKMADHMNRHNIEPRQKVECLADIGLSPLPKKS